MATYEVLERQDDDLLKHLLRVRGIEEKDEQDFLSPNYETGRHDPFLIHDMEKAVDRLLLAIKNDERIAIYSDYDCDGIPGAVILHDFLKEVCHTNFINHIPHRHFDGFGLSESAVERLATEGVDLIITIDCGTADVEAARRAASLNVDLIITDHHESKEELPKAVAIVNPRIGGTYPFPYLCGAAVVFKLVEATIKRGGFDIIPGKEKWWLDMVALATVGDMMPLLGENRVLVSYGLQVLRKSRRPGLQALLTKARADQRYLTEDDIGFTIAPRINAASRMDSPEDAFLTLSLKDKDEAKEKATYLEKLNNERKGVVAGMTKELKKRISEMVEIPDVVVLGNPSWRPALVGLCANALSGELSRPVFLWGRDGNGVIKGSCRSNSPASVVKLMEAVNEHLTEHGGHHASGGFSVKEEAVFHLSEHLNRAYKELGNKVLSDETQKVDATLSLNEINRDLLANLRNLSPFGREYEKPLFAFRGVSPSKIEIFGKTKEHLKLVFETDGRPIEAIAFFADPEKFPHTPEAGKELTLLAHVEESYFMNRLQTRLRIVDIVDTL